MVVFLGAPGSGKGTQARLLERHYDINIFAVGEILRDEIEKRTNLGLRIEKSLSRGEFAPLDIILSLLKEKVIGTNFILDGFPRNIEQACEFDKFIDQHEMLSWNDVIVIDFVVPFDILRERLKSRKICKICDGSLLEHEAECRFCGEMAFDCYTRSDDNEAAIENRLKTFEKETDKLIKFYQTKKIYHPIDATKSVEDVFQEVRSCAIAKNLV